MKTTKFLGLIALAAVITLAFATLSLTGCEQPADPKKLAETVSIKAHEYGLYVGAELTAVYNGPEAPLSYQWKKDGKALSGAKSTTYTPTEAGSYTVTVSKKDYSSKTSEAVNVTLVTVTFNPNGGNWDGSTEIKTALNTAIVGKPETAPAAAEDKVSRTTFNGWYTEATGNDITKKWDFDTLITEDKTLYARWEYETPLSMDELFIHIAGTEGIIWYTGKGATADDPADLSVEIDLGETNAADSNWGKILAAIGSGGKYLALDLSASTMTGEEFNNPDAKTGKDKIVSLTLPTAATSIPEVWDAEAEIVIIAFSDYDNLKEFTGENITSIGTSTFNSCTSLTSVSFPKATNTGDYAFQHCTSLTTVSFPEATTISNVTFYGCTSLTEVSFPKVTTISDRAFENCTSLTTVSFPEATTISSYAFSGCTSLTTVPFPEATTIGNYAFSGCTSLPTTVSFPKAITIGKYAFEDCTSLESVSFSEATTIGDVAFKGCTSLESLSFPEVTTIGITVFQDCTNLESVSFPKATSIGNRAFENCSNLTTVSFPEANSIGQLAFFDCTSLTSITIAANVTIEDNQVSLIFLSFATYYEYTANKAAGTYLYDSTTEEWSKQE